MGVEEVGGIGDSKESPLSQVGHIGEVVLFALGETYDGAYEASYRHALGQVHVGVSSEIGDYLSGERGVDRGVSEEEV